MKQLIEKFKKENPIHNITKSVSLLFVLFENAINKTGQVFVPHN